MFYIDSETNNIYITRGDTASLDIDLFMDDEPYNMVTGDKIKFAIKRNVNFNTTVFSREVDEPSVPFYSADTNSASLGEYDYSITMLYNDGNVDTFLTGKFVILGECYE